MSINKPIANNHYLSAKALYRAIGLLMLCIFFFRVGLVSVYGYAGVSKAITSHNAQGQNNDNSPEEGKYAEKQFKCFSYLSCLNIEVVAIQKATLALMMPSVKPLLRLSKTVLTPPPNH
jgi:hypothetical protein